MTYGIIIMSQDLIVARSDRIEILDYNSNW